MVCELQQSLKLCLVSRGEIERRLMADGHPLAWVVVGFAEAGSKFSSLRAKHNGLNLRMQAPIRYIIISTNEGYVMMPKEELSAIRS